LSIGKRTHSVADIFFTFRFETYSRIQLTEKEERRKKEKKDEKRDYISREIDPQDATLIARGVVYSNCDVTLFYYANNNASTLKA
jgi:hypothetical protein